MSGPQCGGRVDYAHRACRRAMRLERSGRVDIAEALLRRVVSRAAAAGDPASRHIGCEALARLCLGGHRPAEAAVWHQQALSAWCDAGCPGAPDLGLAAIFNAVVDDGTRAVVGERRDRPVVRRALDRARFYAAVRDWPTALNWLEIAEATMAASGLAKPGSLRQSIRVLAALEADRLGRDQNSRL